MDINIESSWKTILAEEFEKPYFKQLNKNISEAYKNSTVYPDIEKIFRAFDLCPLDKVRVVILGQDPYHGAGQAQGLSFSVPGGVKIPPSLQNIYKEIESDLGTKPPASGNLEHWANQGVLLLNSTLTVKKDTPGSHQKYGWEIFTDKVIETISLENEHVVFLLWGKFACSKSALIDKNKHLILETTHPSPFSVHKGFFGCGHFSKTNQYLKQNDLTEIDW